MNMEQEGERKGALTSQSNEKSPNFTGTSLSPKIYCNEALYFSTGVHTFTSEYKHGLYGRRFPLLYSCNSYFKISNIYTHTYISHK